MSCRIAIILLLMTFFISCEKETEPHPFSLDQVWEDMVVDFSIEVIDSTTGLVRIIDHCVGVQQLEWKGVIKNKWIDIPNTYPGDTLLMELEHRGKYVIELVGNAKGIPNMDSPGTVSEFKKSSVKHVELLDNLVDEEPLTPYFSYVKLNSYPSLDEYAFTWDADSTTPDIAISIFYVLENDFIDDPLIDTTYSNIADIDLPIVEMVNYSFPISDLSFNIEMEDIDTRRENRYLTERMTLEQFDIESLNIPTVSGVLEYQNKHFSIGVEWK